MSETALDNPRALASQLLERGKNVVVFDGAPNAGKTTLMNDIARQLPRPTCIDVDKFLNRGQGTFVKAIRFGDLRKEISEAIEKNSFVLVATVCARKVVKRLGIVDATYVYVRKDDDTNSAAALAEKYGEIESDDSFDREIEEYHRDYQPQQNADFCYVRKEIIS